MGNTEVRVQAIIRGGKVKHPQRRDRFPVIILVDAVSVKPSRGTCFSSSASPFRCFAVGTLHNISITSLLGKE